MRHKTEEKISLIDDQLVINSIKLNRALTEEEKKFSLLVQQLNKKLLELQFNLKNTEFYVREHFSEITHQIS